MVRSKTKDEQIASNRETETTLRYFRDGETKDGKKNSRVRNSFGRNLVSFPCLMNRANKEAINIVSQVK